MYPAGKDTSTAVPAFSLLVQSIGQGPKATCCVYISRYVGFRLQTAKQCNELLLLQEASCLADMVKAQLPAI